MVGKLIHNRVVLIELNRFHEEVVYPQIRALTRFGIDYRVFLNRNLLKSGLIPKNPEIHPIQQKTGIFKLISVVQILLRIKKNDIIIFNSIDWKLSKLLLSLVRNRNIIGIVHNGRRLLLPSFLIVQKKCSKILVLNEYISLALRKYQIYADAYYPLLSPADCSPVAGTETGSKEIIFCIPGIVALDKRDYVSLIGWIDAHKTTISGKLKIEILGNIDSPAGKIIKNTIEQRKLEEFFLFHSGFIPYDVFLSRIQRADFILPLSVQETYDEFKITAIYNYAIGFDKILLMDSSYKDIRGLFCRKIFYDSLDILLDILKDSENITAIDDRKMLDYDLEYIKLLAEATE